MSIARHKLQGPRGRIMTPGAIPQPKRRRAPLIDIAKIDAEARATNARLPQQPEPAAEPDPVEDQATEPTTENHAKALQGQEQGGETETLQGQEVATTEPQSAPEATEASAEQEIPASDPEPTVEQEQTNPEPSATGTTTDKPRAKKKAGPKTTSITS